MEALLVVDVQVDFLPGGALAVPDGNAVVSVANELMTDFDLVVATQDWHPAGHGSFASQHPGHQPGDVVALGGLQQILWPDHCVQGTEGAQFAPGLDTSQVVHVVRKGVEPDLDSYSTFFDNAHRRDTGLHAWLQQQQVETVHVMGLATDYCVKFSVLDARDLGYEVRVHLAGCRGVELNAGDVESAVEQMRAAGAVILDGRSPTATSDSAPLPAA